MIFVFGSNKSGIHGAGAAWYARQNCGAIQSQAFGRQGESFAIPTKKANVWESMILPEIAFYVNDFITYTKEHPELNFKITQIGCGHAGYTGYEMAPLFEKCGSNCLFDSKWQGLLSGKRRFWGTYP